MALVFIDANIYLNAYKRRIAKYRQLLRSLEAISPVLFVTRSVKFEFDRNKARVYRDNNKFQKPAELSIPEVYPHYTEDTKQVDPLNRKIRQLKEKTNQEAKTLYDCQQENAQKKFGSDSGWYR